MNDETVAHQDEINSFPERLKKVIGEKSIRSLSRKCGLSEGVLRSYLRGASSPNLDRLSAIARSGGVNLAWLATGEGMMNAMGPEAALSACLCPYSNAALSIMDQGNLKRLAREIHNMLTKQERQIDQTRNLLKGIVRIAGGRPNK